MDIEICKNSECPVDDLLHLIQQDDIDHLQNTLLEIIDRLQPGGEVYFYEQGYGIFNTENKTFSPTLISCIRNGELINNSSDKASHFQFFDFLPTENYIQVFSVESERLNRGLLVTVNKNIINENYINTLLSAYNHQAYLLRNKDTDSLTGLLNRHSLDTKLSKLHKNLKFRNRVRDNVTQYSFAMLDIDLFKSVNDKFGHVYGDEVLLLFSNIMKETFRDIDMLFRYGGEEYAVLLNNVNAEQAESALNRFRHNIEKFNFPMGNKITISIGYCEFNNEIPLSSIIERADKALYYSKNNGRNRVSRFEQLLEQNEVEDIIIDEGDVEIF